MKRIFFFTTAALLTLWACEKEAESEISEKEIKTVTTYRTPDIVELPEHDEGSRLLTTGDQSAILIEVKVDGSVISDDPLLISLIMDEFEVDLEEGTTMSAQLIDEFETDNVGSLWPIRCYWDWCSQHEVDELYCSFFGGSYSEM